jgi:hypothetical protein
MASQLSQYSLLNNPSFPQCFERLPLSYLKFIHFSLSLTSQNGELKVNDEKLRKKKDEIQKSIC